MACGFVQCAATARSVACGPYGFRSNSGSLAILAAMRRASSLLSNFAADLARCGVVLRTALCLN
jgi:hypothetical protein